MTPAHIAPDRSFRIVLKEHMVLACKVDRSVRIVHPVVSRQQMKLRTTWISGKTGSQIRRTLRYASDLLQRKGEYPICSATILQKSSSRCISHTRSSPFRGIWILHLNTLKGPQ